MLRISCRHEKSGLPFRFLVEESGAMLPLLSILLMTLTGFAGVLVDFARLQLVQARLSSALDAAGLAAGSTLNTADYQAEVNKYLRVNFPAGYMGAAEPNATVTVSSDNMVLNLTASTTMPTTFMNIFGIPTLSVQAISEITRTSSGLELVMALDNTGSMSGTKLAALKSACNTLVNILFGSRETVKDLWIGLVPFSQAVNIGTGHPEWMDAAYGSTLNWGPTSWMGCVDANEQNGRDITDDPPSVQLLRHYYSPSTDNRPAPNNSYSQLNANKWVTSRWPDGTPKTYASPLGVTLGPNKYCPQQVQPMTASKTTILNAVNSMQARGNTHIGLGLAWAWRMISPRWRGLWGGEMNANNLPLNYHTPHMNKAVILLSDGANTMDNTNFTAYGYLSDGRLGTTNSSAAVSQLNTRMTSVCNALKSNGVYIYTIALGSPGETIQALLKSCATAESYYFDSPSASDLEQAFKAIGDSLSNLRISQ